MGGLEYRWSSPGATMANFQIRAACLGRLYVSGTETYGVDVDDGQLFIESVSYTYRFGIQGRGPVVRYDDADHHPHPDPHHRHEYSDDHRQERPPTWIGEERRPWPWDILEEAETWYYQRQETLALPSATAVLSRVRWDS